VHPFWSSHEEKRPWLELSMGGGHGRTSSSMTDHGGAHRRGKRGGRGGVEGARLGRGGAPWRGATRSRGLDPWLLGSALLLLCLLCA
jgi:hypothetical protein